MKHARAAKKFLSNGPRTEWHNQALWYVRQKRDLQKDEIPDWEDLREQASAIKEHTLSNLDHYLEEFESKALKNGIHVHWAVNAQEHNNIVLEILQQARVRKLVKSKSMLTEECHLNPFLKQKGIDVIESDLGERIIQFADQDPSHIVLPAIHLKKEEVGKLFEENLDTEPGNYDPQYLTGAARKHLREHFLSAEVASSFSRLNPMFAFCPSVRESKAIVVLLGDGHPPFQAFEVEGGEQIQLPPTMQHRQVLQIGQDCLPEPLCIRQHAVGAGDGDRPQSRHGP